MKPNVLLRFSIFIFLMSVLSGCVALKEESHSFSIGNKTFLLDDKPFTIKAAEIHYTRIPMEYWEHRIEMCKALGMNTICIYAFWNIHEQQPGKFNFKGQNDIAHFCRLAQKHGMYIILRPGPYVCSEWEMGGLPWWLLKKEDIALRTSDPYFLERTQIFMSRLGKELAGLQISQGGNIIMVQIENEYGGYGVDKEYVASIRDIVNEAGFTDVPLFQCDWASTFQLNGLDDLLWTINFGTGANIENQFANLKKARPDTPLMCSEYWSGWFDNWGRQHETRSADAMVQGIKDMLDRNISFSLYMAHGGTTFGHWGGANCPAYSAMCSSYDYDAPISEAGWVTPKYHQLRELLMDYVDSSQVITAIPEPFPVIRIPEFTMEEVAPLFENLPVPHSTDSIHPMEYFDQGWGSILYRTILPKVEEDVKLLVDELHDWGQIYIDGKLIGRLDRRRGENVINLPKTSSGAQLDILVEAMGRVNFGEAIHDRKGITEKVQLLKDGQAPVTLTGWQIYNFPVDSRFAKDKQYTLRQKINGPAYYRGTFKLDKVGDTFLDLSTWGKGMVWVNGHELGRFWKIGPQQTLYMPGCWLRKGQNEIIVLDLLGPEKTVISGLEKPILDVLRNEEPVTHRRPGESLQLKGETPVITGEFESGNGWKTVLFSKPVDGQYFCLEALAAHDGKEIASISEIYLMDEYGKDLSRQDWRISYADSESFKWSNNTADKVFDLQESTFWSTDNGADFPHSIVIDLKKVQKIGGFRYIPRAEEGAPGSIKDYKVYVKETSFKLK